MRNRQTVTRFSLPTWSFFNIAVEFDRCEAHPGMMDIKSYSDETNFSKEIGEQVRHFAQ